MPGSTALYGRDYHCFVSHNRLRCDHLLNRWLPVGSSNFCAKAEHLVAFIYDCCAIYCRQTCDHVNSFPERIHPSIFIPVVNVLTQKFSQSGIGRLHRLLKRITDRITPSLFTIWNNEQRTAVPMSSH